MTLNIIAFALTPRVLQCRHISKACGLVALWDSAAINVSVGKTVPKQQDNKAIGM